MKKEKIKSWLKNPHNLTFLAILILAIIIRLYYFALTKNQPLWWDESDYLAYAKNLAGFNTSWIVTAKHNSLFPFLVAALFKIGFSEEIVKFFLEFIPSILLIPLTYYILIEMYEDKRIALISSFLMAVLWPILFNSMRFHLGIPAMVFGFLAIYIFWKGFEKKDKIFKKINPVWAISISIVFIILTYATRRGYFLFGTFFLIYMLLSVKWKVLIKDKFNWISLGVAVVLLFLTEKIIFISQVAELSQGYFHTNSPITALALGVFPSYFTNINSPSLSILLYLFWAGLILLLINVFISLGHLKKLKTSSARADLFHLITIITTLGFFIFILRPTINFGEPRWYFPLLLGTLVCISRSTVFIIDFIKKHNKHLALIVLIALIGFGGFYELQHADLIIKNKIPTYQGTKDAGLFLKETSSQNDLIITAPQPQVAYYSERRVIHPRDFANWTGEKETVPQDLFFQKLRENPEKKYLVISFSEPGYPLWMRRIEQGQAGQPIWTIPFMDTLIDFSSGQQTVVESKTFEDITFTLIGIKQDIFVYRIDST